LKLAAGGQVVIMPWEREERLRVVAGGVAGKSLQDQHPGLGGAGEVGAGRPEAGELRAKVARLEAELAGSS
jgi:hypothetical protein